MPVLKSCSFLRTQSRIPRPCSDKRNLILRMKHGDLQQDSPLFEQGPTEGGPKNRTTLEKWHAFISSLALTIVQKLINQFFFLVRTFSHIFDISGGQAELIRSITNLIYLLFRTFTFQK